MIGQKAIKSERIIQRVETFAPLFKFDIQLIVFGMIGAIGPMRLSALVCVVPGRTKEHAISKRMLNMADPYAWEMIQKKKHVT